MNFKNLTLFLVISTLIISCSKDSNSGSAGIVIKGTISNSISQSTNIKAATTSYALTDAKKVLLFNSSGSYELFNIENNSFTAKAMQGTATALAFLTDDNTYIGCLHAGGLNVLPLVSLKDGDKTVIDLSTLTLEGSYVIPVNNPLGDAIDLNADEIERFSQFGSFFESLSQNIDTDNDGKADIIDSKALYLSTIYDIYCGKWGLNDISSQIIDTSRLFTNYTLRIYGSKSLTPENFTITLTGPEGSLRTDIFQSYYTPAPDGFISFFRRETMAPPGYPFGSAFLPFENGKYNLNIDDKTYSLYYSNIDAKYFFMLAQPTVHTNELNEIVSISVEYKYVNGTTVNPENFVYQTSVQLNDQNFNQLCQIGALWESPEAKSNTELYNFVPPKKIQLSELHSVTVCYLDLLGNAYNIGFDK